MKHCLLTAIVRTVLSLKIVCTAFCKMASCENIEHKCNLTITKSFNLDANIQIDIKNKISHNQIQGHSLELLHMNKKLLCTRREL